MSSNSLTLLGAGKGFASAGAQFLNDTFTDTTGTNLTAHTPDSGGTWTEHSTYTGGNTLISSSGRIYNDNGATNAVLYHSSTPATADYTVAGSLVQVTDAGRAGVAARIDTAADTRYDATYLAGGSPNWEIRKVVAGVTTSLGTYVEDISDGTTRAFTFVLAGTSLKLNVEGVERIAVTDSAISAAGKVGVVQGAGASSTTRVHLTSITATDA